jgi:hypothetical protein
MQYEVTGFIRVKMKVEADSEEEAIETAAESFDLDKNVDSDVEPEWEVANELGGLDSDEDDEDRPLRSSYSSSLDEEDDD